MRPVIWLLSSSTNVVVRLLGGDPRATGEQMTEQELRDLVITNQSLPADERKILGDVFDATEHTLGEVMRPRHDVVFLRADLDLDDAIREIAQQPHSPLPDLGTDFDDVLGFVPQQHLLPARPRPHAATP